MSDQPTTEELITHLRFVLSGECTTCAQAGDRLAELEAENTALGSHWSASIDDWAAERAKVEQLTATIARMERRKAHRRNSTAKWMNAMKVRHDKLKHNLAEEGAYVERLRAEINYWESTSIASWRAVAEELRGENDELRAAADPAFVEMIRQRIVDTKNGQFVPWKPAPAESPELDW